MLVHRRPSLLSPSPTPPLGILWTRPQEGYGNVILRHLMELRRFRNWRTSHAISRAWELLVSHFDGNLRL
jgi:hypothetical protein